MAHNGSVTIENVSGLSSELVHACALASDSDGTIASTQWLINGLVVATGTSASLSLSVGTTTVTFKATDNDGDSSSTSVSINVYSPVPNNSPPLVAIIDGDRSIGDTDNAAGELVSLSGSASDNDGEIVSYEWLVNKPPSAGIDRDLVNGIIAGTGVDVELILADGVNQVSLRVTDYDGASSQTHVWITLGVASNGFPDYYRSDYLTNWLDRDSDCVNTLHEVLMIESAITPTLLNGCYVLAGL